MTAGTIVVGVDGSDGSRRALQWALQEARLRGAPARVVLAWTYLDQPVEGFDVAYGESDARARLDQVVDAVASEGDDVELERVVVNDLPARALLDAARGADLLVVGSRGLGGFKGLLLGSVSQQVVQHAPCPVVVVPGDERRPSPETSGA
jgi:nucleotide-binding universal stress UspA family protein